MTLGKKIEKGRDFIEKDLWTVELERYGHIKRNALQSLRILLLTIRTFSAQKIGFQSVALSFFCTMAVVPFVAVALAITKGLGLSGRIESMLYENFENNPDVVQAVMTYADNIITKASSSVLGFISAAFFVWLVIWMMLCVERVFNNVWQVTKGRSFLTRFGRNIVIVAISPFLMVVLYASAIFLSGIISIGWVKWIAIILGSAITFAMMYKFIPNAQVKFKNACKAAIFSSLAFTLIQYVYVESQIFLSRLSGIYGAIAAIPFFMFWLNFSWFVILFGAELSYAFQNVKEYKNKLYPKNDRQALQ